MNTNIEISHITKKYKNGVTALDDVSFHVGNGVLACWDIMVPENYTDEGIGYGISSISRYNLYLRF